MKEKASGKPEYVSVGFVARRCGVSNTTVLRWIGAGLLPAFRLPGGHYRVDRNALPDLMARRTHPTVAGQAEPRRTTGTRPSQTR